jgi:serine phosphatase RsbU (regulator of sigma subunit)
MATPSPASSAYVPPPPDRRSPFIIYVDRFWQRVTEGLELSQLWNQFRADATASYRLYQRDFRSRSPQPMQRNNFWETAQEFCWALLEKLTPARRVLLLLGVVLLIFPAGGFTYKDKAGDVQVEEFDFHFFGGALIFVLLMLEVADRVVMKRDLEIARDIQRWLLPASPPAVPHLGIAFATRPANTVAGDYYDVFPRPVPGAAGQTYLLAVADVAGKSIPAAMLMATFQASLKTLSATATSLADLVAGMNRYACGNSQSGLRFTTAFLAEFDPDNCELTYINAGHNAPVLRRESGVIERLTKGGLPLGIMEGAIYESGGVILRPNDWLVIFTDGVIEAVNRADQEYGEDRMLALVQFAGPIPADQMLSRLMADLDQFVGDARQHDDITCLVVRVS